MKSIYELQKIGFNLIVLFTLTLTMINIPNKRRPLYYVIKKSTSVDSEARSGRLHSWIGIEWTERFQAEHASRYPLAIYALKSQITVCIVNIIQLEWKFS